jgi:hypothetical protein
VGWTSCLLLIAQELVFAAIGNGQRQAKLSAPHFNLHEENVHFAGIKIGSVARFPGCGFSPVMKSV